ncbi:MAG: RNA polymerase sigma factor [Candidatus Flexifilum sp.]|jgi:RNA polymerase sigma-70 factor (ECF subfamily)
MFLDASDEQLARKAQLGNREAFQALYQRYLQRVYNRVRSKVPPQDVEDVTQEIFIAVVRSLDSYEQRSRFNTWLYTIVNRQIADFYRRRQRSPRSVVELDDDGAKEIPVPADVEGTEQRVVLQRALQALPEHYQEIILLRFVDGLTFAEIAEQRGQSLEAVKSLYRRAIQAIRDRLDGA